jgi:hypothetical protein
MSHLMGAHLEPPWQIMDIWIPRVSKIQSSQAEHLKLDSRRFEGFTATATAIRCDDAKHEFYTLPSILTMGDDAPI